MISPRCRPARSSASALFPVAVGPRMATTRGLRTKPKQDVGDEREQQDDETELLNAGGHVIATVHASRFSLPGSCSRSVPGSEFGVRGAAVASPSAIAPDSNRASRPPNPNPET